MEALLGEKRLASVSRLRRSMYKCICVGEVGVGKTAIVERFCNGIFSESYKPTFGFGILSKIVDVDDEIVKLIIWDIAGLSDLKRVRKQFYKGTQGVILVFDMTRSETLKPLKEWRDEILNACGKIPFIICGNKSDLETEISIKEVKAFAKEINLPLLFTSAKTGENVGEAFTLLAEKIHKPLAALERKPSFIEQVSDLSNVINGNIPLARVVNEIGCDLKTLEDIIIELYEEGKISGWKINVEIGVLKRLLKGFEGREFISAEFKKDVQKALEEVISGLEIRKNQQEAMMERLEEHKNLTLLVYDIINKNLLIIQEQIEQIMAKIETKGRLSQINS